MTHWKAMEWQTAVDAASGIRVYRLAGVLTDSRDTFTFIEQVRTELRSDPRPVLLDLGGVGQLTSADIGMVATIYASAKNAKATLALSGLNAGARRLLDIVHLFEFIATFANEAEALAAHRREGWELAP
jgi:anti-anti-sigma regulatory factor